MKRESGEGKSRKSSKKTPSRRNRDVNNSEGILDVSPHKKRLWGIRAKNAGGRCKEIGKEGQLGFQKGTGKRKVHGGRGLAGTTVLNMQKRTNETKKRGYRE